MYSTCLCCGAFQHTDRYCRVGARKGDEEGPVMDRNRTKLTESGIMKVKRERASGREQFSPLAASLSRKRQAQKCSLGTMLG